MPRKISLGPVWLKALLNEGAATFLNATVSAIHAGYRAKNKHTFQQIGFMNRKRFEPKIAEWLDHHGHSENRLKIKVLQLMEAKETVFQRMKGKVNPASLLEGRRVVATGELGANDGDTLLEIEVAALVVQVKAAEMAMKVKGLFAPEKRQHSGTVFPKMELTDEDRAIARKLIDQAAQKLMEERREAALQFGPGSPKIAPQIPKRLPEKAGKIGKANV